MTARVVLHLPEVYHETFRGMKHLAIYPRIEAAVMARGGVVTIAGRPPELFTGKALAGDGDLHIVESGRAVGAGWLNATLSYLEGYWHLDPAGVLAESSIGARAFDPALVDAQKAQDYFRALHARFAAARRSRYRQAREQSEVPEGCIAVFLQGPSPQRRKQAYASYTDMLRIVAAGANGRPVVVKAHPLQKEQGEAQIAEVRAQGFDLIASAANVHDILARAAVTVSVNSAAAFEGFLHGKPAVLFGQADFAQFCETVRRPEDFQGALQAALSRKRDYAAAVYWYFGQQCLHLDAPDFEARMWAIFASSGFDAARLGLTAPVPGPK
ncbi:MAG: hypothetical protein ACRCS3_15125 [Paracoccaceae bacterium]